MFRNFLLVGAGGALGSMARYGVSFLMNKFIHAEFPSATFLINILGSFLIGIIFGISARNQWMQVTGYLFLASGICGGFTTFSSFALENINLMQKGQSIMALAYTCLSVVLGLLLCRVGIWLGS